MNEEREGEDRCAVQLTKPCCGEENSALSRREHPARSWVHPSRSFTEVHEVHFSELVLNSASLYVSIYIEL